MEAWNPNHWTTRKFSEVGHFRGQGLTLYWEIFPMFTNQSTWDQKQAWVYTHGNTDYQLTLVQSRVCDKYAIWNWNSWGSFICSLIDTLQLEDNTQWWTVSSSTSWNLIQWKVLEFIQEVILALFAVGILFLCPLIYNIKCVFTNSHFLGMTQHTQCIDIIHPVLETVRTLELKKHEFKVMTVPLTRHVIWGSMSTSPRWF